MNIRRAWAHPSTRLLFFSFLAFGPTACSAGANDPEKTACVRTPAVFQACPGGTVVQGIDVSVYQGAIAWPLVKSAGKEFAFARVSDGVGFLDTEFARNWEGMRAAGLVRGAYQYFRASEDPIAEADVVASSLRGAGGLSQDDLPIVMDIETADGQSASVVRDHMRTWLDAIALATGKPPLVYTNLDTSALIGAGFGRYELWVANWGARCPAMPAGWLRWAFWQYSDWGTVPGIVGRVDLDELDGTLGRLVPFASAPLDGGGANPIAEASEPDDAAAQGGTPPRAAVTLAPGLPGRSRPVALLHAGSAMGEGSNSAAPEPARCDPSPLR